MAKDYAQEWIALAQPHVPQPVVAAGILQPAGALAAALTTHVSGLAGTLLRRRANKKAGGLARSGAFGTRCSLVAVTASDVHAFDVTPHRGEFRVDRLAATWPRAALRATTTRHRTATVVTLDVPATGEHFELDAVTMGGVGASFDLLLRELTRAG